MLRHIQYALIVGIICMCSIEDIEPLQTPFILKDVAMALVDAAQRLSDTIDPYR